MMPSPLLSVNLQARYGKQPVLHDIRFDLQAGEVLGMIGTSGAGKSTLVLSLLGLLPWRGGIVTGQVLLDGRNLLTLPEREARRIRGRTVALVPQSPLTSLNPSVSLRAHFAAAWSAHEPSAKQRMDTRIAEVLSEVQLPATADFLARRPSQISVGQAQRVCIALALLHRPRIVIADEPTSALDPVTQSEIVRLLGNLSRQTGTTLLYISHDLVSVVQLCDRLAVLSAGTIAECLDVTALETAQHPATLALLHALPVPPAVLLSHRSPSSPPA